ncbi:MAG: hypothetical protein JWR67_3037 [Mucilaginibacter sp.]|nr:hypothetical protein [Mucilaginibacter sp.]
MKTLTQYGIYDGENFSHSSELCSLASSLEHPDTTELALYINELCFSYFNQWQLVIDAYHELQQLLENLNKVSDQAVDRTVFSAYDISSVQIESACRDYAYLMITSTKSLLDLIACLVDVIVYRIIRPEHQMVDLRSIVIRGLQQAALAPVLMIMQSLLDKNQYPWIDTIKTCRDRLIHRGYHIKPAFSFAKSKELSMKMIKGNSADEDLIQIGHLFDDFINGLPQIEASVCVALVTAVPELQQGQKVEMHYKIGGGLTQYHFKKI